MINLARAGFGPQPGCRRRDNYRIHNEQLQPIESTTASALFGRRAGSKLQQGWIWSITGFVDLAYLQILRKELIEILLDYVNKDWASSMEACGRWSRCIMLIKESLAWLLLPQAIESAETIVELPSCELCRGRLQEVGGDLSDLKGVFLIV
ncbi:hypothetical protein HNY73_006297 [Argiope bruennichi]|uniref:Uncharacterized protein n=1 Tax=Argiope bruennichi TaxID=94029 RepID=A0A8T0FRU1_ARGBR|nr:hypothetical protein HNY73_006297 [Argiope bruennichi]